MGEVSSVGVGGYETVGSNINQTQTKQNQVGCLKVTSLLPDVSLARGISWPGFREQNLPTSASKAH